MNKTLVLLFALLSFAVVGCGNPNWTARSTAPCPSALGSAAADQERAYLSALLALNDLHYQVVQHEASSHIEAVAQNGHYDFETTWVINVREDGSLSIDQPETQRETHVRPFETYRCRDVDWLRWTAESRGLVPVGAAGTIDAPESTGGSPGEAAPAGDAGGAVEL